MKTPPASGADPQGARPREGQRHAQHQQGGRISRKQLEDIAKTKTPDLTAADLDAAVRTIAGSARSMGVDVEGV